MNSDILIIGGGVAGLSAAAALSEHAKVIVLEAEEAMGFHSSGRSATLLHYALGDHLIRQLTLASRSFFESPPTEFGEAPLTKPLRVLSHAREGERHALEELQQAMAPFATLQWLEGEELQAICPFLRVGPDGSAAGLLDPNALKLDAHALLQGYLRHFRHRGGELINNARVTAVERSGSGWIVRTDRDDAFAADIIVNAAGAWADSIASLAGIRPIGLQPLRRTVITFDAPAGIDLESLPFVKTVHDELYFGVEGGRLFASAMDEEPSDPCDAQPEEYEAALAAYRMEERTTVTVGRIAHRWAGLRTFSPDRGLIAGFEPQAPGFFWFAGQGGFGLQTSPVMAQVAVSLIFDRSWPLEDVRSDQLSPARFAR